MMDRPLKRRRIENYDDEKEQDLINILDCNSLSKIFKYLPLSERMGMEKVCLKWKEASKLAWNDVQSYKSEVSIGRSYKNRLNSQSYVEKILSRCGIYLKELTLSLMFNPNIIIKVANQCKNLTSLEFIFNGSIIKNTIQFVQSFTKLNKLKFIKISMTNVSSGSKTPFPFEIIDFLPEEIEEIHLINEISYIPLKNPHEKKPFSLQKFIKLRKLILHYCNIDTIINELSNKVTLVHLELKYDDFDGEFIKFNKLVNLEHLELSSTNLNFSSDLFMSIIDTCKNLKYLNLPFGDYTEDKDLRINWSNLKNLSHLEISIEYTKRIAKEIVKHCEKLEHLHIEETERISEKAFLTLTKLKNLKSFTSNYCYEFTDELIIAMTNRWKKLEYLNLGSCTLNESIYSGQYKSILENLTKFKYLKDLCLADFDELQDSTVIAIAKKCENIEILNITDNNKVTEKGLMALYKMKKLKELYAPRTITDKCIAKLKNIEKLYCYNCTKLTDNGVMKFLKNNRNNVEEVYVKSSDSISIVTVKYADKITKKRTNGIVLTLFIHDHLIEDADDVIESQWLIVKK